MDTAWSRFKRTLTFRRKKKGELDGTSSAGDGGKPHQWLEDEKKVREGTCSFQVKYLGNIEVSESRGMHVCEEAIKKLKAKVRGKQQRAILYVSGDAIRVVDEITKLKSPTEQKGLIVDQTIEKVSFCSPDRNNDKAFAYICRDGTTRRWLCHGFLAVRDSGERLSHAVGCAFAVCLERKQQRERDCVVKAEFSDAKGTSFTRVGSFRQTTLTEKLLDPQISQVVEPPPQTTVNSADTSVTTHAIPRPRASEDLMYRRFASMRLPSSASAYDYTSTTPLSAVPPSQSSASNAWTPVTPSSSANAAPANPLLLPPPPVAQSSNFRRSASLRLDTAAAAAAVPRRPIPSSASSQFQAGNQMHSSLSTSSQLGAAPGILPFARSTSANAGFSTPIYGNVTSVPPSIPEEDPWSSPSTQSNQVVAAADAVTQLCEQLTAGLLSSPQQQQQQISVNVNNTAHLKSPYQTVPAMNNISTPLSSVATSSSTSLYATAPTLGALATKNPFLPPATSVISTPLGNSVAISSNTYSAVGQNIVPSTAPAPAYFPVSPQWHQFGNGTNTNLNSLSATSPQAPQYQSPTQQTSLPWPPNGGDPFASSSVSATASNNPFKDAPFIANI